MPPELMMRWDGIHHSWLVLMMLGPASVIIYIFKEKMSKKMSIFLLGVIAIIVIAE